MCLLQNDCELNDGGYTYTFFQFVDAKLNKLSRRICTTQNMTAYNKIHPSLKLLLSVWVYG